jgi:hypothetical protein
MDMQRLEPLVGDWIVEVAFPGSPATDVGARSVFDWALDGAFLMQRSTVPLPEAPDSVSIVTAAAEGDGYTQHYFDQRGVVRLYAMTFDNGVWTLTRTAPDFSPLDFSQRFFGTFSDDGRTIDGRWEIAHEPGNWQLDFHLTYRRT